MPHTRRKRLGFGAFTLGGRSRLRARPKSKTAPSPRDKSSKISAQSLAAKAGTKRRTRSKKPMFGKTSTSRESNPGLREALRNLSAGGPQVDSGPIGGRKPSKSKRRVSPRNALRGLRRFRFA